MHRNLRIKLFLFFFLLFGTIIFALMFPRLTLPFGFAYIVYLMAKPLTALLMTGTQKQRIFFFSLLIAGVSFSLFPLFAAIYNIDTDFSKFSDQLPEIERRLQDKFFVFKVYVFERFGYQLTVDPVSYLIKKVETNGSLLLAQVPTYLSSFLEWLLLVPMFLYFFFFQSKRIGTNFLRSAGERSFTMRLISLMVVGQTWGQWRKPKKMKRYFPRSVAVSRGPWGVLRTKSPPLGVCQVVTWLQARRRKKAMRNFMPSLSHKLFNVP